MECCVQLQAYKKYRCLQIPRKQSWPLGRIIQGATSFLLEAGECGEVRGFWEHLFVRIFIILINKIAQAQAQEFSLACLTLTLISSQKEHCDFAGHNMTWTFDIVWWHLWLVNSVIQKKKLFLKNFYCVCFLVCFSLMPQWLNSLSPFFSDGQTLLQILKHCRKALHPKMFSCISSPISFRLNAV